MKKVALTVAVLALGLAACETKTDNTADANAVENATVETDANAAMAIDNSLDAAGNAVENAGEAVENAADAAADATENAAQ